MCALHFDLTAVIEHGPAVIVVADGKKAYASVDAHHVDDVRHTEFINLICDGDMYIELTAFVYQLCRTESVSVRKVLLIALSVKGYFYTALQRIQRQYCHIL